MIFGRRSGKPYVWLAGSGRSGTTWLGNIIGGLGACRQVFEPLNPLRVRLPADVVPAPVPGARPYLHQEAQNAGWEALITGILRGDYDNSWTRFGNYKWQQRPRVWLESLRFEHLVIKEVRSNLLLGWLARQMHARPVLLVRHPCATIASQQQRGWTNFAPLLADSELIGDHFSEHEGYLREGLRTDAERFAARWALENVVPLRQSSDLPILVVTYEHAVLDPVGAVRRIAAHLGWPINDEAENAIARRAADAVSGLGEVATTEELLTSWQRKVSMKDREAIVDVISRLGANLYDLDVMPQLVQT